MENCVIPTTIPVAAHKIVPITGDIAVPTHHPAAVHIMIFDILVLSQNLVNLTLLVSCSYDLCSIAFSWKASIKVVYI